MLPSQTPLDERFHAVRDYWNRFAQEPDGRLLIWLIRPDEGSLVEAMLVAESDARAAEVPDLFVRIGSPFGRAEEYSAAVRKEFIDQYESSWDALAESERPPRFTVAPGNLFDTASAFLTHHSRVFEQLVLVLQPTEVSDEESFATWLGTAAQSAGPIPRLRFLVLLPVGSGEVQAESVLKLAGSRVRVEKPDLNVPAMLEALSRQAGNLSSPGGQFRHLFVQLTNALGAGELMQAERLGNAALAITAAQSWPSLSVAVHFALGGGLLAAGQFPAALQRYQAALSAAQESVRHGAQEGHSLVLRSQLAIASVQVRSGDYVTAAATYEQAAPVAAAQTDLRMQLECWRMASFCHESSGTPQRAWESAQRALTVAQSMDAETRTTSTLPYLGEAIERLSKQNIPGLTPDQVGRWMDGLLEHG